MMSPKLSVPASKIYAIVTVLCGNDAISNGLGKATENPPFKMTQGRFRKSVSHIPLVPKNEGFTTSLPSPSKCLSQ